MEFRNCKQCGKLFRFMGNTVCPECVKSDEEDFEKVKEFLKKNEGAGVGEVVEGTGVEHEKIISFLREERLELKGGEGDFTLTCEICGGRIRSGRYCSRCLKNLHDNLSQASTRPEKFSKASGKSRDAKFRIIDRYKKDNWK